MYTFVSFTVAELFEKVWQTPMVKLAHDTGVYDVAVAKAWSPQIFLLLPCPLTEENQCLIQTGSLPCLSRSINAF